MLWLGIITFLAGAALIWATRRREPTTSLSLRRLAFGVTALGLGTLSMTQPGPIWIAASIVCSTVAIGFIGSVLWGMLTAKR